MCFAEHPKPWKDVLHFSAQDRSTYTEFQNLNPNCEKLKLLIKKQLQYFLTYLSCGKMRSCSELYNSWRTLERNWPHHLSPPQSWTSRRPVCNRIFGVPLMHKCLKSSSQAWAWNVLCKTAGTECPITKQKTIKFPI